MLKKLALPTLGVYVVALTIGSLSKVRHVPKLGSSFDDKIYHFLAYAILTFLCYNYLQQVNSKRALLLSLIFAIAYGIIIEGLQSVLTDFRTPDYFDIVANTLGAIVTFVMLQYAAKRKLN